MNECLIVAVQLYVFSSIALLLHIGLLSRKYKLFLGFLSTKLENTARPRTRVHSTPDVSLDHNRLVWILQFQNSFLPGGEPGSVLCMSPDRLIRIAHS